MKSTQAHSLPGRLSLSLLISLPLTGFFLSAALPQPTLGSEITDEAEELLDAEDYEAARLLLTEHLQRQGDDANAHALLARAHQELDRDDESAHHYDVAIELLTAAGKAKDAKELMRQIGRVDKNARSRRLLFEKITKRSLEAAEKLVKEGSLERAIEQLENVRSIAAGKDAKEALELLAELKKKFERVDLDAAGSEESKPEVFPLHEASSVRYDLSCNLEPDVVQLIGETMDHIFDYYVTLYFDGDESKVKGERATIRIHPDKKTMLGDWQGGSAPEGWWSPGDRKVVSFDTRTSSGSLDSLLETLFHEASHQFMTLMTKGGRAPAWLNEGTASFFEGAVAMADNRVLWPDAALGRLMSLSWMLDNGNGPKPLDVITYSQPGSYPGEYYAFGWGFIYYLQQWEDPETLEYVYRPLYGKFRDEITSKGGDSLELFEKYFLGKKSPRGHLTFEDFEKDWIDWILNTVKPLHREAAERRDLRIAEVNRYLAAADAAKEARKPKVPEEELLRRGLLHLEYVRTRIDGDENPDGELILRQADILERLGYKQSVAPLLESYLDLVDQELIEIEPERYEELEEKLKKLDSRNYALRAARAKAQNLLKNAKGLIRKYENSKKPMPLRTYTLAAALGRIFEDEELAQDVDRLKGVAREAGVLVGMVRSFSSSAKAYATVFTTPAKMFEIAGDQSLTLGSTRPSGRIDTSIDVGEAGEYEVRAVLERSAGVVRGSYSGLIFQGGTDSDWLIAGLNAKGDVAIRTVVVAGGGTTFKKVVTLPLTPKVTDQKSVALAIRMTRDGQVEVRVNDRDPVVHQLEEPRRTGGLHPGVFVKDAKVIFKDATVEVFP